jgi:hypothetical protein
MQQFPSITVLKNPLQLCTSKEFLVTCNVVVEMYDTAFFKYIFCKATHNPPKKTGVSRGHAGLLGRLLRYFQQKDSVSAGLLSRYSD